MKLDTFFDNFGLLADAPNGVQKLREMILQLAVQGKLVPQDPKDEPASVKLEKIKAEKERLIKEGKIKKAKPLPPIDFNETPYELPNGWEWIRLGQISEVLMGNSPPGNTYNDSGFGVPLINGPVEFSNGDFGKTVKSKFTTKPTKLCKKGDLLICVRGSTTGRTNIADFDACIGRGVAAIQTYIYQKYSNWFMVYVRKLVFSLGTGSTFPSISYDKLIGLLCPLPPINEQKRIVAKVDELMSLCDELETRKQQVSANCIQLNDASIHKLLTAREPKKFNNHWQRICGSFDLLYSKPENVSKLRKAILQLAVQGKLVPQDPKDEPASVLLEKITTKKERLIKDKKIRKSKLLPPIKAEETFFEVPYNWEWARLGELGEFCGGGTPSKKKSAYWDGSIPWVSPKDMKTDFIRSSALTITQLALNETRIRLIPVYSILIVARSGILKRTLPVSINMIECAVNQDLKVIIPVISNISEYLRVMLKGNEQFILEHLVKGGMTVQSLKYDEFEIQPFPIPPLEEQKRIVAKVDELMALCDKLETSLSQSQTNCDRLMEAAVTEILAA